MRATPLLHVLGAALVVVSAVPASAQVAPPGYTVVRRIAVPGDFGWDYVTWDANARRLFVSHGMKVDVVDPASGAAAAEITPTPGVHGIALAPNAGRGYITDGRTDSITVFDLKPLAVVGTVKSTGEGPDAILFEPVTNRIFAFNGEGMNATVLDAATGAVVGTVALGGAPEFGVADGKGFVFVNLEDKAEVALVDAKTLSVVRHTSLGEACTEPTGLAIDRQHRRLFSVCHSKVMVVTNADDGSVVKTLPIGARVDGAAFDSTAGLAFASNGEGTVTVVRAGPGDKFEVAETVTTTPGARTMTLDPATGTLYLPAARLGPPPAGGGRPSIVPGTFELLVLTPAHAH